MVVVVIIIMTKEELIRLGQLKTAYIIPLLLSTMDIGSHKLHVSLKLPNLCPGVYIRMQKAVIINTYLLTPWCRVLLEKLTGLQPVEKFPTISRNPEVHYRTHKRPPPISIRGPPNPVHIPTSYLLEIHPNIIHPSTPGSPQWCYLDTTIYINGKM